MFKAVVAALVFSLCLSSRRRRMASASLLPICQSVMPAPVEAPSSWYLRGDIGVGNVQPMASTIWPNPLNNPSNFTIQSVGMQDQAF